MWEMYVDGIFNKIDLRNIGIEKKELEKIREKFQVRETVCTNSVIPNIGDIVKIIHNQEKTIKFVIEYLRVISEEEINNVSIGDKSEKKVYVGDFEKSTLTDVIGYIMFDANMFYRTLHSDKRVYSEKYDLYKNIYKIYDKYMDILCEIIIDKENLDYNIIGISKDKFLLSCFNLYLESMIIKCGMDSGKLYFDNGVGFNTIDYLSNNEKYNLLTNTNKFCETVSILGHIDNIEEVRELPMIKLLREFNRIISYSFSKNKLTMATMESFYIDLFNEKLNVWSYLSEDYGCDLKDVIIFNMNDKVENKAQEGKIIIKREKLKSILFGKYLVNDNVITIESYINDFLKNSKYFEIGNNEIDSNNTFSKKIIYKGDVDFNQVRDKMIEMLDERLVNKEAKEVILEGLSKDLINEIREIELRGKIEDTNIDEQQKSSKISIGSRKKV